MSTSAWDNEYVAEAIQDYNRERFLIENGHIKKSYSSWDREDVVYTAANDDIKLTDKEIDEVMFRLIEEHDASIGINWETISYIIQDVKEKRENNNGN